MNAHEVVLVVPCHNEAARLDADAFLRYCESHPGVGFIFVDDGSTDGTWDVVEKIRSANPEQLATTRHAPRRGKGEAVRAGMLQAFAGGAPLVGFLDADLATPLEAIDDFLALLRLKPGVEFVLGSRVRLMGRDVRRHAVRHYTGRVFATAASLALDLPVYDTQCGAKVLRANAETRRLFAEAFRTAWIFDVELLARYLSLPVAAGTPARRDRLYELVLPSWHDQPGSKLRWHHTVRALADLVYIWRERVASTRRGGATLPDSARRQERR
jgi:glycosyltransferase involved in cell wall biosynthesis